MAEIHFDGHQEPTELIVQLARERRPFRVQLTLEICGKRGGAPRSFHGRIVQRGLAATKPIAIAHTQGIFEPTGSPADCR